jgi:hypothetical protein
MNETKNNFAFISNTFTSEEVILKGEKKYFVEGFISTTDEDLVGDIVTSEGQDDLVKQLLGREITLDLEHEEWYDSSGNRLEKPKNQLIPVAKIVKAERRTEPKNGTWVKAELNSNLGNKFKSVWGSIQDGFLRAFSIAFYPVEAVSKKIDGVIKTFISKLNLVNVTLTGSPMLPEATFVPVMKAALKSLQESKEEIIMSEEKPKENIETPKVEEIKPVEVKKEEVVQPEIKPEIPNPIKVESPKEIPQPVQVPTFEQRPLDLIKAFEKEKQELVVKYESAETKIKAMEKTIAELKEIVNKPIIKANLEETPNLLKSRIENPLDQIK